ncbi:MBL fold metallo-hydrolase [Kibdelosporangium phytohabitans]|uniref:MBL fold metallo-hydrolase n=1 Tax=Kibdelosporangium phytohabitans TaxID=860235 RepID=A0A0N9HJ87_9PSEU|nr:MBL fold metallo-hydrolase [Kibdelosporangium phytohabitans]ALG06062.1 MBL fold metallo-hydrolase [Kibdelosporangium phytohabitans]MBE1465858.1 glyoxylase-like metal-dependent hydrolase (beta-lactamase superfamily II) [Kibdelosporangium phytohabitans]
MGIMALRPFLYLLRLPFGQAYLWQDGDEFTLIDTGVPGSAGVIADAVTKELGRDTSAIRRVVITHGHHDHHGSAADVRSWHGAPVHVHSADADVVRGLARAADPVLTEFDKPIWEHVTSLGATDVVAPPCAVDVELADGDELDFGGGAVVLHLPGHTPGSVGIHLPEHGVLFTGDTVANQDGVMLGVFNQDEDQVLADFQRLAELDVATACFGHGEPVVAHASAALREAVKSHHKRRVI